MNISYLKYIFKKYKTIYLLLNLVYLTSFSILLAFVRNDNAYMLKNLIYIPAALLIFIGYVVPVLDYHVYFEKNSSNVIFSLPDRRANIYRTSLYFHLVINMLIFSLTYIIGILILMINGLDLVYGHLFSFMGYALLIFIGVYFLSSFITSKCSNIYDAVIINVIYLILPAIFIFTMYVAFNYKSVEWSKISYIGAIQKACKFFPQVAITNVNSNYYDWYVPVTMAGIGVFLHFLAVKDNVSFQPEDIGDLSKSWWGYKTLIPLLLLAVFLNTNWSIGIISFFVLTVTILMYIIYTLLNKKKKIRYYELILILVIYFIANILVLIF